MSYCCVPGCRSNAKKKVKGISFHEIPSEEKLRARWLEVIPRRNWYPNTTWGYTTVCSLHFLPFDFKEGCKTRRLKRGAVPSAFQDTSCVQPDPKKARYAEEVDDSPKVSRTVEAAATGSVLTPLAGALHHSLSPPCLFNPGQPALGDSSPNRESGNEPEGLGGRSEGINGLSTTVKDQATQAAVRLRTSASPLEQLERRRWARKERDLRALVQKLQRALDACKTELKSLKEDKQFLARDLGKDGEVSSSHIKKIYKMQQNSVSCPVSHAKARVSDKY
ncbi:THAP domain-containing protein 3-like [Ornithodoros turicata]|uniref:THAP domain-containing protein 3-like n=1 Tax=Ornithodoros turicata TaxID=34597 RepID=UPI00313A07D7